MLHLLCQVKRANAVETHRVHAVCQTTSKGSRIVTRLNKNLQMHLQSIYTSVDGNGGEKEVKKYCKRQYSKLFKGEEKEK